MANEEITAVSSDGRFALRLTVRDQKLVNIRATEGEIIYDCKLQLTASGGESKTFCCWVSNGVLRCVPGPCN